MSASVRRFLLEQSPRVRRVILLGLVIGIPLFFLRVTSDPFNVPKLALLIVGVASVSFLRCAEVLQGASRAGLQRLMIPAFCLAVPLVVSWAASPYRSWSLFGLQGRFQGLLPYLLLIMLGVLLADAFAGRLQELAVAICWAGAVMGAYTIIQALGMDPFRWTLVGASADALSTTGNSNFTGGFLGIVLPLALGLFLTGGEQRQLGLRLLIPISAGWILAGSQGGWGAGMAGAVLVITYGTSHRQRWVRPVGLAIAGAISALVIGSVVLSSAIPERLAPSAGVVRARWWQAAASMGSEHFLVGRGPNVFAIEGVRHRSQEDALVFGSDFPTDPHSVPLSMWANLGLLGLIGFVLLLVWAIRTFTRVTEPPPIAIGFFAASIAYFVQASVSIDEITLRAGLWTALAGIAIAASSVGAGDDVRDRSSAGARRRGKSRNSQPLRAPLAVGGVVMLLLLSIWGAGILVAADARVHLGESAFAAGDAEAGAQRFHEALSLRDSADYRGSLALELMSASLGKTDSGEDEIVDVELAQQADEAFSFTDEVPYAFSLLSHGRLLYLLAEDGVETGGMAVATLERAFEIDPRNPVIRIELALALVLDDEPRRALELLIPLKDVIGERFTEYWGVLAFTAARAEEVALAREALDRASSIGPLDARALEAQRILGDVGA